MNNAHNFEILLCVASFSIAVARPPARRWIPTINSILEKIFAVILLMKNQRDSSLPT